MTLVLFVIPELDGVVWSSIIPIYEIEERDVEKFKKLITNSTYIQDIEKTYEKKGKYFLITTKTDYRKALTEANNMIKYISTQI